ncbi:MAG TPA: ATP-binding protein [Thermoanaerobaculia bacterium]|nr:ATP-binding protein [Thermoanaerobaculia bacterium]
MTPLARQLRWYIAIRVVAIVSVLLPFGLFQLWMLPAVPPGDAAAVGPPAPASPLPAEPETVPRNVVWLLGSATFAATLFYIVLLRLLRRSPTAQAYIQFFGDLVLITGLVYFLGGAASPFSLLYLIVIAVASTLLRRRAGVTVASAAFLMYGGIIVTLSFGWLQPATPAQEAVSGWRLGYNLAVHGFGFYAVALLTYYLAHNVTRAERALEEKSEHLADLQVVHRDVIQSISSGLLTTDLEGTVTSANLAGLEILGREEEDLVGSPIHRSGLFSAELWNEVTAASVQTGRMRSEVELARDKEPRYVGFSISRLTDAEGHHRGYIVIFQDLTRWRRMQEELRIKDRMVAVGELAAGLAHEIGNPLAAISGSVQMLSGSVNGDPAQSKLIDILLKESHRLDRTIKGFLRFARPRDRSSVSFDIARLLAENFELLKNSEEVSERHRLEVRLDPPSARLFADPDQVSQIFWNLARNALRAMPDGGTLRVVGRLAGDCYRLQVIDTGRGMSEEQRANLFHPFQSFFDGGTGIGMAIVYRIVQDHGGRLRVDSRPDAGTTITIELPATAASVTLLSAETPT